MGIGERIRKTGFKRWHERTLIEGHAYLVSSLLGTILAFGGVELLGERNSAWSGVFGIIMGLAGVAVVLFATPRYFRMLALAGSLGDRATCPRCKVYAAFDVISSGGPSTERPDVSAGGAGVWLKVRCRKCDNEWRM